jgi:hypothetical protein
VSPSSWYKEFMTSAGGEVGSYKPSPRKYTGPPMDLANMRRNVTCPLQTEPRVSLGLPNLKEGHDAAEEAFG